jgi:hypothetical protein
MPVRALVAVVSFNKWKTILNKEPRGYLPRGFLVGHFVVFLFRDAIQYVYFMFHNADPSILAALWFIQKQYQTLFLKSDKLLKKPGKLPNFPEQLII